MENCENSLDLDLIQNYIANLRIDGFTVFTSSETDTSGENIVYGALVMKDEEYAEKLSELNAARYTRWRENTLQKHSQNKPILDFESLTLLDEETAKQDPRYIESDSALQAIIDSSEMATKLLDNAPPEEYYPLTGAPEQYDIDVQILYLLVNYPTT